MAWVFSPEPRRRQGRRHIGARLRWAAAWLLGALTACGGSGGSSPVATAPTALAAADLALLVAQGDPNSEAIALAYQQARGIPEAHMIRVPVPSDSDVISEADFVTLKAKIDALLAADVQATLVTWLQPSRVQGACAMGITSALAFGYDAQYCGGCNSTKVSAYYDSPTHKPFTDLGIRPSMMLGAATLADAQALIARGVAADGVLSSAGATGQGWLVRTSDATRSVRYPDFETLASTPVANTVVHYLDNSSGQGSDLVTQQADVIFYFTGLAAVGQLASNRYLPGAVGDTVTSYAGLLPGGNGQTPVTAWLQALLTASYGTVEEPCAYDSKFARASILVKHYQAGETLLEAYWKSVLMPGQGLFVGEPLARPWKR